MLLESASPISDLVAAERCILVLALLIILGLIAAVILIALAVRGVRRRNAPVVDALRRSEDAVNAVQDESENFNAYLARKVTEEEAHQRLRSYFLANISHEFRTPLSALRASLELLVNEENPLDPAEARQVLRAAHLSLVGLQTLIDNLLISSAIEAGRFSLHLAEVDMRVILADAVRVATPLLERRQQPLIVELPAAPALVHGDGAQLTQVVLNLLINASKYSPVGSAVEATVAVRVKEDKGEKGARQKIVRVAVADRGPGVDPALRSEIFRRFVRGHDSEREQYGVGLGLYVAKTTILAHGGRIDVENRPGGGALFWFELNAL